MRFARNAKAIVARLISMLIPIAAIGTQTMTYAGSRTPEASRKMAAEPSERQITHDPIPKHLDNNLNFSPDGRYLCFDCRPSLHGIQDTDTIGKVDVRSGEVTYFYKQIPPVKGIGAVSFLNSREVIAIHALKSGIPYDLDARGGMIIPVDGKGSPRWLDSRDVTPPFTPGALRGGTHRHEPDSTGEWIGFTYNDWIMKTRNGSDLRNVGVGKRGIKVRVHRDPKGRNFEGESFCVLLSNCVDHPNPGTDEYQRADGDCWVGERGYIKGRRFQRARAFRGLVSVREGGKSAYYSDVFIVDVPDDITRPGPLGPLEGTLADYPKPPEGAEVHRLTRTAEHPDPAMRGVSGQLRTSANGRWIVFVAKALPELAEVHHPPVITASQRSTPNTQHSALASATSPAVAEDQLFLVSPFNGEIRQLSRISGGVVGNPRFSPDSRYVAEALPDGRVGVWSTDRWNIGEFTPCAPTGPLPTNLVISPDSRTVAYNREVGGVMQIFLAQAR